MKSWSALAAALAAKSSLRTGSRPCWPTNPCTHLPLKASVTTADRNLGYLEATVEFALKHPSLSEDFSRYLAQLVADRLRNAAVRRSDNARSRTAQIRVKTTLASRTARVRPAGQSSLRCSAGVWRARRLPDRARRAAPYGRGSAGPGSRTSAADIRGRTARELPSARASVSRRAVRAPAQAR